MSFTENVCNALQVWKPAVKLEKENGVPFFVADNAVLNMRIGIVAAISFAAVVWTSASSGFTESTFVIITTAFLVTYLANGIFSMLANFKLNKNAIEIFKTRAEIPAAVLEYLSSSPMAVEKLLKQNEINFKDDNKKSSRLLGAVLFPSSTFALKSFKLTVFKMLMKKYQEECHPSVDLSKLDLHVDTPLDAVLNLPESNEKKIVFDQVANLLNQQEALTPEIQYSYLMKAVKQTNTFFLENLINKNWLDDCLTADNLIGLFCNANNPDAIILLTKQYDINVKNDQGMTPLLHLLYRSPDECKLLLLDTFLKAGADRNATAIVNGQELSVANYLESHKCDPGFKELLTN